MYYYPLFMNDETGSAKHTARYQHLNPRLLRHATYNCLWLKQNWAAEFAGVGGWSQSF